MSYKTANTHFGQSLYSKGTNVRTAPGTTAAILYQAPDNSLIGFGTRRLFSDPAGSYWIEVVSSKGLGWVRADVVSSKKRKTPVVASGDGKAAMKAVLEADKQTFKNLLYVNELIERYTKAGKQIEAYKELYNVLTDSYNARQKKVRAIEAVEYTPVGPSLPGFGWLVQKFALSMVVSGPRQIGTIGFPLALLIPAVAGVVIGALAATALYLLFKDEMVPATVDLDRAETLAKVLEQVDGPTQQKVLSEINSQMKEVQEQSYDAGKSNSTFGDLKTILFGVVAFYAADKLIFSKRK